MLPSYSHLMITFGSKIHFYNRNKSIRKFMKPSPRMQKVLDITHYILPCAYSFFDAAIDTQVFYDTLEFISGISHEIAKSS